MAESRKPISEGTTTIDPSIDYYGLLGVKKGATEGEITKAYRKMALKYHPDKSASLDESQKKEYASMFIAVGAAYEVLVNKKTRDIYDNARYQTYSHETYSHETAQQQSYNENTFTTSFYAEPERKKTPEELEHERQENLELLRLAAEVNQRMHEEYKQEQNEKRKAVWVEIEKELRKEEGKGKDKKTHKAFAEVIGKKMGLVIEGRYSDRNADFNSLLPSNEIERTQLLTMLRSLLKGKEKDIEEISDILNYTINMMGIKSSVAAASAAGSQHSARLFTTAYNPHHSFDGINKILHDLAKTSFFVDIDGVVDKDDGKRIIAMCAILSRAPDIKEDKNLINALDNVSKACGENPIDYQKLYKLLEAPVNKYLEVKETRKHQQQ